MSKIGGTPVPTNTLGYNMYGMTTQNPKGDSQNPKSGWAGTVGQIAGAVASGIPNVYDYNDNESIYNDAIYGDAGMDTWARAFDVWSGNGMKRALNKIGTGKEFNPFYSKEDAINAWDNNMFKSNVDYTNPLLSWQGWVDNAKAGLAGMSKGSIGGPWGMLGGLASEGTLHWLTQIGSKDRADKLNRAIDQYNINSIVNYGNELDAMNARNIFNQKRNYIKAEGGSLEEQNGVTKFNVGGTHSQNPYDGIQQGIASDGNPNLVEENELKYKDYIYSARLKPSKSLLKEFNLPEKYAGKSFAEIGDKLQKESEDRPNDPISLQTLDDWMSRLAGAQEEYKAKAAERKLARAVDNMSDEEKAALLSSLEQPMAQQEGIDLSQPMYAKGGKIHIKPENRGKLTALKKRTGKTEAELWRTGGPAVRKMITFARNARKWKHADGGHLFQSGANLDGNPYDFNTLVLQDILKRNANAPLAIYDETGIPEKMPDLVEVSPTPKAINHDFNIDLSNAIDDIDSGKRKDFNGSMLRYAPAIGALTGALEARFQPKDFDLVNDYRDIASQYKPLGTPHVGSYRKYTPYDVNLGDAENLAMLAAALEANRGQDRATQGALNTAVIAKAQETSAKRNLAAQQANEANRLAVDTYNLGIDQFNAQQQAAYDRLNQQILQNRLNTLMSAAQAEDLSKQMWAQNVSSTTENAWNQLGNVGRDEWNRNQRDALLTALGAEGIKELLKTADGRAWLAQNGYYNS